VLVRADGSRSPAALAAAAGVLVLALGLAVATAVLAGAAPAPVVRALALQLNPFDPATGLVLAVAGAVLLAGEPRSPLGRLLAAFGVLWTFDTACASWAAFAAAHTPFLPCAGAALWFTNRAGAVLVLLFPLVLALYPHGRLPAGRWRAPVAAGLAATAALPVALLVVPAAVADDRYETRSPLLRALAVDPLGLPLSDAAARGLLVAALPCAALGIVVVAASVVARWRGATGLERQRLGWLLWAALVDVLVVAAGLVVPALAGGPGVLLAAAVTGAAVVVGLRRPRLVDVDALLGRTLVYAVLGVLVVALDAAVVAVAGATLGDRVTQRGAVLALLLAAALVYLPVRAWLWRGVRRLVLGERDQPYRVLSTLAARLEAAGGPQDQLLEVAAAVAAAFRVPYVVVEVDAASGERVVAEHGTPRGDLEVLPITYGGTEVGRLRLPRAGLRARLTDRDQRLLGDVVRQAAVVTRTAQLARQLQASREALVVAREEERRRIRRDLHDGLGPALGAVVLRIDTARNLARQNPDGADGILKEARADVAVALADVRRLVHDLRPPALDDVGLEGALRQQAGRLRSPGLTVTVEGDGVSDLPAAVEVAAYRIASEAMLNVQRHAGASRCRVSLHREDGSLVVEVHDDGIGIDPDRPSGVGLLSLRERAAELGGSCEVVGAAGGGTLVRATLPVGAA
jgi:signal transduction histidine kinase